MSEQDIVYRLRHGFLDPIMGVWRTTPQDMEAADEIERLMARLAECEIAAETGRRAIERNAVLEALLHELIDIEGPQPGHVMWYRKVQHALRAADQPPVTP
jgi:hypothetical protein